ncbi:MAG: DUF433 domain-containing protein [Cyanobium sp. LacPavin_0920_WC12_MAG_63_22]|nr:DUF433 domain-containing protein [Cyanobium sp. LacPavin_0920_WC12_MAG_63_22]
MKSNSPRQQAWAGKASLDFPRHQVRGTRVPVAALFENLEDGVSMTKFVECFPGAQLE